MNSRFSLPPFWVIGLLVAIVVLIGVLSLLTNGRGGILGVYYVHVAGPELERAYGFRLAALPSGADSSSRYFGFTEVSPSGPFGRAGIKKGDLLANKAWIYHGAEEEGLYQLLFSAKPGQQVAIKVIAQQDTVGIAPIGWEAR